MRITPENVTNHPNYLEIHIKNMKKQKTKKEIKFIRKKEIITFNRENEPFIVEEGGTWTDAEKQEMLKYC